MLLAISPSPPAPGSTILPAVSMVWTTLRTSMSGIRQDLPFCDWHIALSIMFSGFIHVVAEFISFLRQNNVLLCVHATFRTFGFSIRQQTATWLACTRELVGTALLCTWTCLLWTPPSMLLRLYLDRLLDPGAALS